MKRVTGIGGVFQMQRPQGRHRMVQNHLGLNTILMAPALVAGNEDPNKRR